MTERMMDGQGGWKGGSVSSLVGIWFMHPKQPLTHTFNALTSYFTQMALLGVIVHFIVNLAGPWCPNIWPNIILDISVKVFSGED